MSDSQRPEIITATSLRDADPAIHEAVKAEIGRQSDSIELIASENFVSQAVLDAQGSVFTNKYAEGYPNRRYYGGCVHADSVEDLAIERLKQIYGAAFANVQPHSGSQANQSVLLALLKPGDTILGLDLKAGGHLTHGSSVNLSGRWFNAVSYGVNPETHLIDMDEVEAAAKEHQPKLIIAGGSAYPRLLDFPRFRAIAASVGAIFMVDMAHFAGLVAGGAIPSPMPHADIVTSTTHKTLRGPRGGIVLTNNPEYAKKINSAVFPGLQGGPLVHVIAAKAVSFKEALDPSFRVYAKKVIENSQALAQTLAEGGLKITTNGTDTHLSVVDLRPMGVTGNVAEEALESVNITVNKNSIPNDPEKPMITSGIRIGTAACTSRGFGVAEFQEVGRLILETLEAVRDGNFDAKREGIAEHASALISRFPLPYREG